MQKLPVIILLIIFPAGLKAQNIQLHYDFDKGRECFFTTVEMFKPDKYGSTFFFVDMDYDTDGTKGLSMAYWEIARAIRFWEKPVAFHIEYNGGMGKLMADGEEIAYTINDSWLGGIEYSFDAKDFSRGITFQALFKTIRGKQKASFQLTGVWYLNILKNKMSFTGFADFWQENMKFMLPGDEMAETKFIFQSEPQIWYNFSKNISAGSEVEISHNFVRKGLKVMPSLGVKATF